VIHYSALVIAMSLSFWITSSQGVEGSYFTLMEFSRLPREAFGRLASIDLRLGPAGRRRQQRPAREILHGFEPWWALGLLRRDPRMVRPRRGRVQERPQALHERELMSGDLDALQAHRVRFRDPGLPRARAHARLLAPGQPGRRRQQPAPGVPRGLRPPADPHRGPFRPLPGRPRGRAHQAPGGPGQGRVPLPPRPRDRPRRLPAPGRERGGDRRARRDAALEDAFEAAGRRREPRRGARERRQASSGSTGTCGAPRVARGTRQPQGPAPGDRAAAPRQPGDALRGVATEGADHEREYEVAVYLLDRRIGSGRGPSKKLAEEEAARAALATLGPNPTGG
jgi:hypothetical protein